MKKLNKETRVVRNSVEAFECAACSYCDCHACISCVNVDHNWSSYQGYMQWVNGAGRSSGRAPS